MKQVDCQTCSDNPIQHVARRLSYGELEMHNQTKGVPIMTEDQLSTYQASAYGEYIKTPADAIAIWKSFHLHTSTMLM